MENQTDSNVTTRDVAGIREYAAVINRVMLVGVCVMVMSLAMNSFLVYRLKTSPADVYERQGELETKIDILITESRAMQLNFVSQEQMDAMFRLHRKESHQEQP